LRFHTRIWPYLILMLLALVWGSSFILIKRSLDYFSSYEVGALRISIAFIFLLPLAIYHIRKMQKKDIPALLIVGFAGNLIPSFLFAVAQTHIDSSLAGILNSLTPLFTLVIGLMVFGTRIKGRSIAGVIIGLAGATGLIVSTAEGRIEFQLLYASLVVLATIGYAININVVKHRLQHLHPVHITLFAFLLAGPAALIYLVGFTSFTDHITGDGEQLNGLIYVAILAIFGSALAIMVFNKLIQLTNAVFSSSVTYLIPLVAIFFGVIDGESIKISYLCWMLLILGGVFLVNYGTGKGNNNKKNKLTR